MPAVVTPARIEALLDEAETQEHVFWGKEVVISYKLRSGYTVTGRASTSVENFDMEVGRHWARQDAIKQLWPLEAYLLYNQGGTPMNDEDRGRGEGTRGR